MTVMMRSRTAAAEAATKARHDIEQATIDSVGFGAYFQRTRHGLIVTGDPSIELCGAFYEELLAWEESIQFAIGDMALYIREHFGELASQVLTARSEWSDETYRNMEWVAEKIPPAIRRLDRLTWTHHQAVAGLPTVTQRKKLLDAAAEGEEKDGVSKPWPVSRLKLAIKANGDQPVTAWHFIGTCDSEAQRDEAMKLCESKGVKCKPSESRK